MRYNTVRTYKSIIEKYLKPNLGEYRLSGLTSYQLNKFVTELCNKYDYSREYIRNILKVLKASFRDATDLYGFINYNPTLTWEDIDFINKTINVKHNIYAKNKGDKGKWFIGDTKTQSGERQVYICNTLLKVLKNYKKQQKYYEMV